RFAAALAAELRAVGITLDYAPVLDIHTNPKNPVIGDRAFSQDAAMVPGRGGRPVDSHRELPLVEHPPDRIRRVECVPFAAAIKAGVAFIMTAHVLVPSLDDQRPATLSPRIAQKMLP